MTDREKNIKITVIKRNGKKVPFDGTKIAIAIKKGFDSVVNETNEYTEKDINKIYTEVLEEIARIEKEQDRIKIEEIQDLIEDKLQKNKYKKVYESFSKYRENRSKSRNLFLNEKKQHKFVKIIETLGLGHRNKLAENINTVESPSKLLKEYGGAVSEEFAKAYLIKEKHSEAHEEGIFHIHNFEYLPTGATINLQLNLEKIFESGFKNAGVMIREPKNIMSYALLTNMIIDSAREEQSGTQTIPAFDYFFSKGVLNTFKKEFKKEVFSLLNFTEFDQFVAINGIEREMEKIESIDLNVEVFYQYVRQSLKLRRLLEEAYKRAIKSTDEKTYQAIEAFLHNINITDNKTDRVTSINLGTDTSAEGRLVTKKYIQVLKKGIGYNDKVKKPLLVFKLKKGINVNEGDKNFDLLKEIYDLIKKGHNISLLLLDTKENSKKILEGDFSTETALSSDRSRVIDNFIDPRREITFSRGTIAINTINLPRLGIKHMNEKNIKAFFKDLDEVLELAKESLLEQFEIQCDKRKKNFPFLLGENIWLDSDRLKEDDRLRRALKQGNFSIGFIGLEECLKAICGEKQDKSKEAIELGNRIVKYMRKKCDQFTQEENLNFTLYATGDKEIAEKFNRLDRSIYGKIKDITDTTYTDSFMISGDITNEKRIEIESQYHSLTNGGHEMYLSLDKINTFEDFKNLILGLIKNNVGVVSFIKK